MSRPSVLIVEPEASRRRRLGQRLAELGYEAVPAVDAEEGIRFAEGLGPSVIVADAGLPGLLDEEVLERLAHVNGRGSLVLLGSPRGREEEVPSDVRWIPSGDDLDRLDEGVVERLRLVLIGREIGVEPDPRLDALVGDLALSPPLEVIRALARLEFTGKLVMQDGEVVFDAGEVVAAGAGEARGVKAFCRLGRRLDGAFRVWPASRCPVPEERREIHAPVEELVIRAVEDASVGELPSPRTQVEVEVGPAMFTGELGPLQQTILTAAHQEPTLGRLLEALPEPDGELIQALRELEEGGLVNLREPDRRVQVVTDSTADLPRDLARRLGIEVVPLQVIFGDRRFVDGVDLQPREFYGLLESGGPHPSTEPPSVDAFDRSYRRHLERRDLVSIHISSRLSETFRHARTAGRENLDSTAVPRRADGPAALEVVDSGLASLGLGLMAVFAARMALRGRGAAEIAELCRNLTPRCHTLFVVDTLEYLQRGGRIGRARAWIGELLRIKPILAVEGGEVVPLDKVRGGRAAHPRIVELLGERLQPDRPVIAGVAHAEAPVWAESLGQLLEDAFDVRELLRTEIGPVVGTHAGPGTVGCVVFQPGDEELELLAPVGI